MSEIIINFRESTNGIKLIPVDDIIENYRKQNKTVPFQWVACQYVDIAGVSYAIVQIEGVKYPSLTSIEDKNE